MRVLLGNTPEWAVHEPTLAFPLAHPAPDGTLDVSVELAGMDTCINHISWRELIRDQWTRFHGREDVFTLSEPPQDSLHVTYRQRVPDTSGTRAALERLGREGLTLGEAMRLISSLDQAQA